MKLDPTEEQQMIQAMAREFAETAIRPIAAEIDREGRFPHETVKRMGELGLMGIAIPEDWGGSGADTLAYVLALEEIAKACGSHAAIMSVNNSLYCDPVYRFGTDTQRERLLKPAATGHALGCFALTEPQAGSDARNQHTLAVRDDDHYVLNGRKQFVTNGREASFALVFCQTDRAKAHHGITALVVEKGTKGFVVPKTEDKLGIRASDTAELVFEDCRVPAANRLGEEGMGFGIALAALDGGRVGIAAQAVGLAAGALERSLAYARERKSFGVAIGQHQMVQWMLADMATTVDGARSGPSRSPACPSSRSTHPRTSPAGRTARSSATRASTPSPAASTPRCTVAGSGPCGCSRGSAGPRTPTPASSTFSRRGRRGS